MKPRLHDASRDGRCLAYWDVPFPAGYPGDVGECPESDLRCAGQTANLFYQQANQDLWRYATFNFTIRTFTWKFGTDQAGDQIEFARV